MIQINTDLIYNAEQSVLVVLFVLQVFCHGVPKRFDKIVISYFPHVLLDIFLLTKFYVCHEKRVKTALQELPRMIDPLPLMKNGHSLSMAQNELYFCVCFLYVEEKDGATVRSETVRTNGYSICFY